MRTRIIFGIIIISSFCWIGYAFWLVEKQHQTLSIHTYFGSDSPLFIINRVDGCLPEINLSAINDLNFSEFIQSEETFSYWKSVVVQIDSSGANTRILLEEKTTMNDEYLKSMLEKAGVWDNELPTHNPRMINNWYVVRANGFLAISNQPIVNTNKTTDSVFIQRIRNRDIHASYSVIDKKQSHEVYCFKDYQKHFQRSDSDLQTLSPEVSDLDLYSILPTSTNGFFFMEKTLLLDKMEEWRDESFSQYIDKGVVFANIENKTVLFIDIIGQYVPQEILTEFARDKSTLNSQIVLLNQEIGPISVPFATGIENVLIVCEDKDVLEKIRLSYQKNDVFSTSKVFSEIKNQGAHKVHFRWYNPLNLNSPWMDKYPNAQIGYGIYSKATKQLSVTTIQKLDNSQPTHKIDVGAFGTVVWNFTLENKNSQFFLNEKTICVYNPEKKTISLVDIQGKVITWMQLTENLKTIHPMEGGFLIEQFNQLIWMEENAPYNKKEIPFSGAIASTIAPYIWKGVPSIGLISENKLYRISLNNGKSEITNIPGSNQIKKGQLHAFNHEGDLSFGVFSDSVLHVYNSKKERWKTTELDGNSVWSKKINGKIFYLSSTSTGYIYRELFKTNTLAAIATEKKFHSAYSDAKSTMFLFKQEKEIEVFTVESKSISSFQIDIENPEMIVPLIANNKITGIVSLNGILNKMSIVITNNSIIDTNSSQNMLNASQFVKLVTANKVITFVDGQLVMYSL